MKEKREVGSDLGSAEVVGDPTNPSINKNPQGELPILTEKKKICVECGKEFDAEYQGDGNDISCQECIDKRNYEPEEKLKEVWSDDSMLVCCILCGKQYLLGTDGNELGFCLECQRKKDFPYDLDAYYRDYEKGKVIFKGFETMDRGILEPYRKEID